MQGSAKYSTKALSPGIAACGSTPRQVAAKPQATSAKKGKVISRTDSTRRFWQQADRKSTRLNSSHTVISYAGVCFKKKDVELGCRSCACSRCENRRRVMDVTKNVARRELCA